MSNPETVLQSRIRLALGQLSDLTLWRNSVGMAEHNGSHGSYRQRYGLATGSADLIGILAPDGRFIALEIKVPGKVPSPERIARICAKTPEERSKDERHDYEQHLFLANVRRRGGFGAIVWSEESALAAIERARQGANE